MRAAGPPGVTWQYNNYHPILVGLILERVTGMKVSDYLSREIWRPLGMEAPGSWSLDSDADGFEKMESGINARARDFARFGLLYAHGGAIEGQQLIMKEWVAASTQPHAAQNYGYFWWLDTGKPGAFAARGNLGQLIYVDPRRAIVVIRLGERRGDVDWLTLAREVAAQVR